MTAPPCLPVEDLALVAGLPASDPRRAHVAACPRCRALVDAYARFADPGGEIEAPHVAAADARLTEFVARTTGAPAPSVPAPSPARRTSAGAPWWRALLAPAMRPALGFAAAAVVLVGIVVWPRATSRGPVDQVRGGAPATSLVVLEARLGAGGFAARWNAVDGADAYEVRVYDDALHELARLNADGDTVLAVSPSELPFRPVPGQALLVRVEARAGGAVIASAPPFPLAVTNLAD